MVRRSLRNRRKQTDAVRGIILAVIGIVLLFVLGGAAWWVRAMHQAIDESLCPKDGPHSVAAILFDRSDPIAGQQVQQIKQHLLSLIDSSAVAQRFDIYTVEADPKNELHPILQLCNPGRGKDANLIYQNPDEYERRFRKLFLPAIEAATKSMLEPSTRPTSPIIESIRAAAITSFGPFENREVPLRMLIISDMVQHSAQFSQVRGDTPFSELAKQSIWRVIRPNLEGAEVDILYVQRPNARRSGTLIQSRGHQLFWEQLMRSSNGRIVTFEPI